METTIFNIGDTVGICGTPNKTFRILDIINDNGCKLYKIEGLDSLYKEDCLIKNPGKYHLYKQTKYVKYGKY